MDCIWRRGAATAEQCREVLLAQHPMKDSTARTVLRRLEQKGLLRHRVKGRTYIYWAAQDRRNIAARAASQIIDRLCGGSVEQLLTGMVESDVLDAKDLERLARKISRSREGKA